VTPVSAGVRLAVRSVSSRAALLILCGPAALAVNACHKPDAQGAPPLPEVSIVSLTPQSVPVSYEFSGQVVPYRRVEVRARVEGIILERPFSEGQLVTAGQLLYKLDPVQYEAAFRSAEARYANAKQHLARLEPLVSQHAVAQQDVDNARSENEAAQASLAQARKDYDDTFVRAEIEGRVGRTEMEVGGRVTGPANLLTTIDRLNPVYVSFRPSSKQLGQWNWDPVARALIRPGSQLEVQVTTSDGRALPRTGRLNFVAPSLDPSSGTQEFRAIFANPDHVLVPGEFVRVRLSGFIQSNAVAVPIRAVQTALGRQFVYVVGPGDTAAARDVEPGHWSGNLWIIEQGLRSGDRVIVDGVQKVFPGRMVRPVPLEDSAALARAPANGREGSQRPSGNVAR
jgi:membrane fusion protein (multidrug efflux system)